MTTGDERRKVVFNTTTKQIGDFSELAVMKELMGLGFIVSIPFGQSAHYDLIAHDIKGTDRLLRIQVKTATKYSDVLRIPLSRRIKRSADGKKYDRVSYEGDCDVIIAYSPDMQKLYWISKEFFNQIELTLRLCSKTKNNQKKGVHFAKDFEGFWRDGTEECCIC